MGFNAVLVKNIGTIVYEEGVVSTFTLQSLMRWRCIKHVIPEHDSKMFLEVIT